MDAAYAISLCRSFDKAIARAAPPIFPPRRPRSTGAASSTPLYLSDTAPVAIPITSFPSWIVSRGRGYHTSAPRYWGTNIVIASLAWGRGDARSPVAAWVTLDRHDARASRDDGGGWATSWRAGIGFGILVFGGCMGCGVVLARGEVMRRASLTHPTFWWPSRLGGKVADGALLIRPPRY